jgi:hypothetical protein
MLDERPIAEEKRIATITYYSAINKMKRGIKDNNIVIP